AHQRAAAARRLGRWRVDPALAGVRDPQALAALPEAESRRLRDLWRRVDEVRARTLACASREFGPGGNPRGRL
ncbi:MAG: hypothetical protein ACYC61_26375, partial [Isosphaeraceae bacterium]